MLVYIKYQQPSTLWHSLNIAVFSYVSFSCLQILFVHSRLLLFAMFNVLLTWNFLRNPNQNLWLKEVLNVEASGNLCLQKTDSWENEAGWFVFERHECYVNKMCKIKNFWILRTSQYSYRSCLGYRYGLKVDVLCTALFARLTFIRSLFKVPPQEEIQWPIKDWQRA